MGISAITAHSLCPSLGIANLASDAGFDNGCRYVAKLKQVVGSVGGRAHEFEHDSKVAHLDPLASTGTCTGHDRAIRQVGVSIAWAIDKCDVRTSAVTCTIRKVRRALGGL